MITWIIIAVAIAAIFGLVNIEQLKNKTMEAWSKLLPHVQKIISKIKEKK